MSHQEAHNDVWLLPLKSDVSSPQWIQVILVWSCLCVFLVTFSPNSSIINHWLFPRPTISLRVAEWWFGDLFLFFHKEPSLINYLATLRYSLYRRRRPNAQFLSFICEFLLWWVSVLATSDSNKWSFILVLLKMDGFLNIFFTSIDYSKSFWRPIYRLWELQLAIVSFWHDSSDLWKHTCFLAQ